MTKPGLAPPAPLHLHYGFLLQWLSLTNTNHLHHFITNILVPLLLWAWTHQLTLFPSPGHLIEKNRALPFSSYPFPSAQNHWYCWDTAAHFEGVCTLTNTFSLQEHWIKCLWGLVYCQESLGGTWSSWGQALAFLLLCPVFSESAHSSSQMGFLKMNGL